MQSISERKSDNKAFGKKLEFLKNFVYFSSAWVEKTKLSGTYIGMKLFLELHNSKFNQFVKENPRAKNLEKS